jgi:predicted nucleic acid-binding protein
VLIRYVQDAGVAAKWFLRRSQGGPAIDEVVGSRFPTFPTSPLIQPAIQIARAYNRAVYDCVYIALAMETNTQVITADEKLANSSAGLPVTWLGLI